METRKIGENENILEAQIVPIKNSEGRSFPSMVILHVHVLCLLRPVATRSCIIYLARRVSIRTTHVKPQTTTPRQEYALGLAGNLHQVCGWSQSSHIQYLSLSPTQAYGGKGIIDC